MKATSVLLISALTLSFIICCVNADAPLLSTSIYKHKGAKKVIKQLHSVKGFNRALYEQKGEKQDHLVMFGAAWCPHCHHFAKFFAPFVVNFMKSANFAEMRKENPIKFDFVDCNGKTSAKLCSHHKVSQYPTIKMFKADQKGKSVPYNGAVEGKTAVNNELVNFFIGYKHKK